jgi:hypothetical protein
MDLRTIARSFAVGALVLAGAMTNVSAQTDYAEHKATEALSIGLGYSGGLSLAIDQATNYKIATIYSDRFGLDASYPLSNNIAASLGLGIDNRGGKYYWYLDNTVWEIRKVRYFSINPGVRISAFYLGLNLGIPLSGVKLWQNGADAKTNTLDLDPDLDKLNLMVEPQLGAMITLVNEKMAWLGLSIVAGYNLNNLSDKTTQFPGEDASKPISSNVPSLRIGLTGQFAIPGTYK